MSTIALPHRRRRVEHDGRPAPRWAVRAAHLAPLVTLPSGLWRIGLALGFSMGMLDDGAPMQVSGWEIPYIFALSLVAEGTALLTIGLVRPWGERVPRWIPLIGGRRVPARPVVAVAATGSLALALIWGTMLVQVVQEGFGGLEMSSTLAEVVVVAAYAPLLLWAPLVAAVTYAYWKRRCRD